LGAASKAKRSHHKKKTTAAALPPPVEVETVDNGGGEYEDNLSESESGLLSSLGNLLKSPEVEQPKTAAASLPSSGGSSESSIPKSEALPAEAERLLAGVPDLIGGEGAAPGGALPDAVDGPEGAGLLEMVGSEIVDAEAAAAVLQWVGGALADWRKREAYRDAGRNAAMAGKHWARVCNQLWQEYAPGLLADVADRYPGLVPALALTAIPFGMAVWADVQETSKARKAVPLVRETAKPAARVPNVQLDNDGIRRPAGGGIVFEESEAA
jgi:hypothetical protein